MLLSKDLVYLSMKIDKATLQELKRLGKILQDAEPVRAMNGIKAVKGSDVLNGLAKVKQGHLKINPDVTYNAKNKVSIETNQFKRLKKRYIAGFRKGGTKGAIEEIKHYLKRFTFKTT